MLSKEYRKKLFREGEPSDNHENRERWLLTYADMITLLLGLFIILYSISNVDRKKLESVAEAIRLGFGFGESIQPAIFDRSDTIPDEIFKPRSPVYRLWERLGYNLKRWKEAAKIKLGLAETEELTLTIFAAIQDEDEWIVDETQDTVYRNLADLTKEMDIEILIRLEVPTMANPSTWDDSARRSAKLANVLARNYKIPKDRIAIIAHTGFRPLPNLRFDSPEEKAKQERIEFTIRRKK